MADLGQVYEQTALSRTRRCQSSGNSWLLIIRENGILACDRVCAILLVAVMLCDSSCLILSFLCVALGFSPYLSLELSVYMMSLLFSHTLISLSLSLFVSLSLSLFVFRSYYILFSLFLKFLQDPLSISLCPTFFPSHTSVFRSLIPLPIFPSISSFLFRSLAPPSSFSLPLHLPLYVIFSRCSFLLSLSPSLVFFTFPFPLHIHPAFHLPFPRPLSPPFPVLCPPLFFLSFTIPLHCHPSIHPLLFLSPVLFPPPSSYITSLSFLSSCFFSSPLIDLSLSALPLYRMTEWKGKGKERRREEDQSA